MRSKFLLRVRLIAAVFIIVAALLSGRLYFIQIVRGDEYQKDAVAQYVAQNADSEKRGTIFFTAKDGSLVSAAVMQSGWRVAINPKTVDDPEALFAQLSSLIELDKERFFTSAAKKSDPYEEVAFRLTDAQAAAIRAKKLSGVILVADQWRFYPGVELAAQTLGFVAFKGERKTGVYGLERSWQDTLAYTASGLYVNPFAEIFSNVKPLLTNDPKGSQGSIVTSIEPSVQQKLESTLDEVMRTYSPRFSGGIVMDPHTGEIVGIALRPAFDPNTYNLVENPAIFSNQLVEGRYEMGSIMKPLTMAAGIDAGAVTPVTTYNDTGCTTRSTKKICNWDLKARGVVPMQEVLNQSLNLGVAFVADRMGHDTMARYFRAYGFGEKTGIDLPNEVTGDISTLEEAGKPDVNFATAAFGQGVSISAVQMTRALAALANGGRLPNPHVVKAVKYDSGLTRAIEVGQGPQVLSTTTVQTVTRMLTTVFDDALLKGELKQQHYSIAAKTGTAQIAVPGGGYYPDRFLHSFFGYFPAREPRYIVFLFAVEPHGAEFASATLAHPFLDIAKYLINYYDIPPDR